MTINIEKMRSDMAETQKWETRKFLVSLLLASAALLGAGAAIGNYLARHEAPPQPMFPPRHGHYNPGGEVISATCGDPPVMAVLSGQARTPGEARPA